jgi:hypothetical protein
LRMLRPRLAHQQPSCVRVPGSGSGQTTWPLTLIRLRETHSIRRSLCDRRCADAPGAIQPGALSRRIMASFFTGTASPPSSAPRICHLPCCPMRVRLRQLCNARSLLKHPPVGSLVNGSPRRTAN